MDRSLRLSVLIAAVGGLVLRFWVLASPIGALDADEAVTALMAERVLDFEPAVFFWDQQYGGTLDSLLTAPVLLVTGPSVVAVKLVTIVLHAVACVLIWRLGRRILDERVGLVAASLAWVASPAVVWWSTKARGFYGAGVVLVVLAALLVSRLIDRSECPNTDADRRDLVALGFTVGLAWWTTPITLFAIGPALIVGLAHRRDLWRSLWVPVGPFVLGGLPWWVFNIVRGFSSFDAPIEGTTSYAERVDRLVRVMTPMLVGLRQPFSAGWTLGPILAGAVIVALVAAAWRLRDRSWLLVAMLVGYPLVAAVSATSEYVGEPRYGFFLAPFIAVVAATALRRHDLLLAAAPVVLLTVTTLGTVALAELGEERRLANYDLAPPATEPLVAAMAEEGITHLHAEYWLAYRLTFESDLVATPNSATRDSAIEDEVLASGSGVIAFYRGSPSEWQFVLAFGADSFRRVHLDDYVVYVPLVPVS